MTEVNTPSGDALKRFVDRIERLEADKAAVGDDITIVYAEVKARGFVPKILRNVIKRRKVKPVDLAEAETLRDLYLDLLGMGRKEAPLFRHVGLMEVDVAAKETVIEALKQLVPLEGEIIVKAGGTALRLWRDKDGEAHAEDYKEPRAEPRASPAPAAPDAARRRARPEPPPGNEAVARNLGRQAAKDNKPVIDNPYPHDDPRRPSWDEGWRDQAGSDGMGPPEAPAPGPVGEPEGAPNGEDD